MARRMSGLKVALVAGLALVMAWAIPAEAKQPPPVELPLLVVSIADGAGGEDVLRVIAMLQPRNAADAAVVQAERVAIAAAMRDRLRSVSSTQLIPPKGNTAWLERELWNLAERMLKPMRLDGAFFRELTIH